MARDNFSDLTKSDLARNAHLHCVYPGCPRATHGPTELGEKSINVGHAAHASAASPKGPRFNTEMTPEQRKAYENGAWLCAHHATLIDRDPESYPVETIRGWQKQAEDRAREALTGRHMRANIGYEEVCSKLEAFLKETNRISITIHRGIETKMQIKNEVIVAIGGLVSQCSGWNWRPTNKFHSLDQTTSSIQQRAIGSLSMIHSEVSDSTNWYNDGYHRTIIGAQTVFSLTPQHELDRINASASKVVTAYLDYLECINLLRQYASGKRSFQ